MWAKHPTHSNYSYNMLRVSPLYNNYKKFYSCREESLGTPEALCKQHLNVLFFSLSDTSLVSKPVLAAVKGSIDRCQVRLALICNIAVVKV